MNENQVGRALDWGDSIEKDGTEFVVLPDGDYDFEVISFSRGRHGGSEKLPPCNKAELSIRISGPAGSTTVTHNLFLHTKTEGMLSAFFVAIGQKKKGEALTPDWNTVVGAKGRCKVVVRTWTGSDGQPRQNNDIKRFYEPGKAPAPAPAPVAPTYTAGQF